MGVYAGELTLRLSFSPIHCYTHDPALMCSLGIGGLSSVFTVSTKTFNNSSPAYRFAFPVWRCDLDDLRQLEG